MTTKNMFKQQCPKCYINYYSFKEKQTIGEDLDNCPSCPTQYKRDESYKKVCCGLMGKIFGHCFISHIILEPVSFDLKTEGEYSPITIYKIEPKKYEIRCKRCGRREKDD